jgi:hypothetical protein
VRRRDRDAALALFRRVVDRIKRAELDVRIVLRKTFVIAAVSVVLP